VQVTASCIHTHHVTARLGGDETFILAPRWSGGKPLLVTSVSASAHESDPIQQVELRGFYAKKDGSASAVRPCCPERTTIGDLPKGVQDALRLAMREARHE
jgi:hypothetical protein